MEDKEFIEFLEKIKKSMEKESKDDKENQKIIIKDIKEGDDYIYVSRKYTVLNASLQDTLIFMGVFLQKIDDKEEIIYFLKEYLKIKEETGEVENKDIGNIINDIIKKIVLKGDE